MNRGNTNTRNKANVPATNQGQNPLANIFQNPDQLNSLFQMTQQIFQGMDLQNANPNDMQGFTSKVVDQAVNVLGQNMDPSAKSHIKQTAMDMATKFSPLLNQTSEVNLEAEVEAQVREQLRSEGRSQDQAQGRSEDRSEDRSQDQFKVPEEKTFYQELDSDDDTDIFQPRTKDLEIPINVSLEDLYNGGNKKLGIKRKRIVKDHKTKEERVVEEIKKIVIPILPGMRDEQELRYNKQGDELPGYDTGDIVIQLRENGHDFFERDKDNLFVVKKISLYESFAAAANVVSLTIRTLDNRILLLNANGIPLHLNDGLRKVQGEGMPKYQKAGKGDLFIRFDLILPETISDLQEIKGIFPPIDKEIVYHDNSKNSFDLNGRKVTKVVLNDVTEEDLSKMNYQSEYSESSSSGSSSESSSSSESKSKSEVDKKRKRRRESSDDS